jgi:methionine sulfoxide reductase catalytic subunit
MNAMTYQPPRIPSSEITPKDVYVNRRKFMTGAAAGGIALTAASAFAAPLTIAKKVDDAGGEKVTPKESATTYNNFYEFGTDKGDPVKNSGKFKPLPWAIKVDGLVDKPQTFGFEDLLASMPIEERIYRMRCVEAWSMVIPWDGFQLSELLKKVEPQASAKFVAFETVVRPEEMPGQSGYFQPLPWPYVDGLRLDEAMHPLTILSVGMYGEALPNQSGAPIRLVVPWKYGFKSIKSIVRITLTDKEPPCTWNLAGPSEYGFYSNVNPKHDHPRWSQATERRIGEDKGFFKSGRRDTLMFNGYDEVASLYTGMDLDKYF